MKNFNAFILLAMMLLAGTVQAQIVLPEVSLLQPSPKRSVWRM